MKLAKATKEDIENALNLLQYIENSESIMQFMTSSEIKEDLLSFYEKVINANKSGGLMRVIYGFKVLVDNNAIDQSKDYLDWHPDFAEVIKLRKTTEECK
jgi:glycerol-3-phosphate responsive antiterminator